MEDPEIEMRYLKEKRKVDDSIYTVDPQKLEGLKKLRDKKKTKIEELADILEYQEKSVEPVELEDLPHMQGKVNLLGKIVVLRNGIGPRRYGGMGHFRGLRRRN